MFHYYNNTRLSTAVTITLIETENNTTECDAHEMKKTNKETEVAGKNTTESDDPQTHKEERLTSSGGCGQEAGATPHQEQAIQNVYHEV